MNETDLQVLSSPGNLTESEIGIVLKAQEDYQSLLKENYAKDKKIISLERQLLQEQNISPWREHPEWVSVLLGGVIGFFFGSTLVAIPLSNFAYDSGQSDGLKWKQELCQIKHPRSATAYQSCLSQ